MHCYTCGGDAFLALDGIHFYIDCAETRGHGLLKHRRMIGEGCDIRTDRVCERCASYGEKG